MIISFIQAIFTVLFYFVTIPIFNGYLLLGYSTYYTSLPIFALVLDEDVTREKVDKFPALYQTLQKGRSLNLKTFLIWTWKSIYQACIIMFVAIMYFDQGFVNLVTITFTALICVEMLNLLSEVTQVRWLMVVSILISMAIYIGSIVFFRQYFEVSYIDWDFCVKVSILSILCWLPIQIFRKIMEHCDPSQEQKIMKSI